MRPSVHHHQRYPDGIMNMYLVGSGVQSSAAPNNDNMQIVTDELSEKQNKKPVKTDSEIAWGQVQEQIKEQIKSDPSEEGASYVAFEFENFGQTNIVNIKKEEVTSLEQTDQDESQKSTYLTFIVKTNHAENLPVSTTVLNNSNCILKSDVDEHSANTSISDTETTVKITNSLQSQEAEMTVSGEDYSKDNFKTKIICDKKSQTQPRVKKKYSYKPVECPECKKMLCHAGSLATHMRLHTGEKPYKCEKCDRSFAIKLNYKNHLLTHQDKEHTCPLCGWKFTLKRKLEKHIAEHDQEKKSQKKPQLREKKGPHICDYCGKSITSLARFQIHTRAHSGEKAFICDVCGRGFNVKCNYKRHLLRHKDTKPYKCQACERTFYEKRHMIIHMKKLHKMDVENHEVLSTACSNEMPETPSDNQQLTNSQPTEPLAEDSKSADTNDTYKCQYCASTFTTEQTRKAHQNRKHFICSVCGKDFATRAEMKSHSSVHREARPFTCGTCGKTFKLKKDLRSHEQCHTEKGRFACNICPSTFRQHQGLWRHLRYHQDIKPHVCSICQKSFAIKGDLTRHQRSHASKKRFKCQQCSQTFETEEKAIAHVVMCYSGTQLETVAFCASCNSIFENHQLLASHVILGCPQQSAIAKETSSALEEASTDDTLHVSCVEVHNTANIGETREEGETMLQSASAVEVLPVDTSDYRTISMTT